MTRYSVIVVLVAVFFVSTGGLAKGKIGKACTFKDIPLNGKVQFVQNNPDFTVEVVEHFEDLKVQMVDHFPSECGKWQVVEHFPDFKVKIVEHFGDFKIRYVSHFPGMD